MRDLRQWYAIAGSAPGCDDDLWIESRDFFGGALLACFADELAAGGSHQFSDPRL
jgi:hypothetical protein